VSRDRAKERPRTRPENNLECITVTGWAVGRMENSSLIALRFNDDRPHLLNVTDARGIAAALLSEAGALDKGSARQKK
jgi:hypothetical protein